MTGSNHAVMGALIAAVAPQPLIAIPLAFVSHFVLDMLPHFGNTTAHSWLNKNFSYVLLGDAIVGGTFLLSLAVFQPAHWGLMIICALVAVSPDIMWLPYYLAERKGTPRDHTKLAEFFKWIQWGERPWGLWLEIAFFIISLYVLVQIIR